MVELLKSPSTGKHFYRHEDGGMEEVQVFKSPSTGQTFWKGASGEMTEYKGPEKAAAADYVPIPEVVKPELTSPPEEVPYAAGLASEAAQGATLGFSDEIMAALDKIIGGEYDPERYRAVNEAFASENPKTALAAQIGGGLATGGAGAARVLGSQAVRKAPAIGKFAATVGTGAAEGAVAGAGTSTEGERLEGAGEGAMFGAGIGAVLPPAVFGAKKLIESGIVDPIRKRVGAGPQSFATSKVGQAMQRDEISPEQARAGLDELGPEAALMDVGGANTLDLARTSASMPGPAKQAAEKFLYERAEGVGPRVLEATKSLTGAKGDFYGSMDELSKGQKALADKLYGEAREQGIAMTDELSAILKRPKIKKFYDEARDIAEIEGRELPDIFVKDAKGNLTLDLEKAADLNVIDHLKRGMDAVIESKRDITSGRLNLKDPKIRALQAAKRDLLSVVDEINPKYAEARSSFAGVEAQKDAMRIGRRFMRGDAEIIDERVGKMSVDERAAFMEGVARSIEDMVDRNMNPVSVVNQLLKKGTYRKALEAVFPEADDLKSFEKFLKAESKMAANKATVTGGSPTARITASQEDFMIDPDLRQAGLAALRGDKIGAAMGVYRKGKEVVKRPPARERDMLADMLYTSDRPAIDDVLGQLTAQTKRQQVGGQQTRDIANILMGGGAAQGGRQ